MCTITLEYYKPTPKEIQTHRELMDAVIEHSRKSMSHVIARYVDEEVDKLWESSQWDDKKNEAILNDLY